MICMVLMSLVSPQFHTSMNNYVPHIMFNLLDITLEIIDLKKALKDEIDDSCTKPRLLYLCK